DFCGPRLAIGAATEARAGATGARLFPGRKRASGEGSRAARDQPRRSNKKSPDSLLAQPTFAADRFFAAALALHRKKLAAFSAAAGRFLRFPIGDRRGTRMRASASKRPVTRAQALTNATLAASRLLHPQVAYRRRGA